MTTTAPAPTTLETLADLVQRLGDVPLDRIRAYPAPGTATEADLVDDSRDNKKLCELADGVLVLKPMGYDESLLAGVLIYLGTCQNFASDAVRNEQPRLRSPYPDRPGDATALQNREPRLGSWQNSITDGIHRYSGRSWRWGSPGKLIANRIAGRSPTTWMWWKVCFGTKTRSPARA